MKKIRLRFLVVFVMAACSGALLLRVSQNVQHAEENLAQLQAAIAQEENSTSFLKAEWAYLNNPERLEKLANKYTDLVPPSTAMMAVDANDVPPRVQEKITPEDAAASSMIQPAALQIKEKPQTPSRPLSRKSAASSAAPAKSPEKDFTEVLDSIRREGAQ